jgi:hypothetical protein
VAVGLFVLYTFAMPEPQIQNIKELSTAINDYDFIIVGEMHGSKQNAPLMKDLAQLIAEKHEQFTIAFEWPLSNTEQEDLDLYIQGGPVPSMIPSFFIDSDGRFTYEHIVFLKWIRNLNISHNNAISITTFDTTKATDDHEKTMADLLTAYKKEKEGLILVETGNMHARRNGYTYENTEIIPLAGHLGLQYKIFSIFLHYKQGEINVEGVNRDVTQAATQREGPMDCFDTSILIPHSVAAKGPGNLTEIADLLK